MRFFRIIRRSIRDAFKSVSRNFSLSLASISCITITLILVSVAIIASLNVENFTAKFKKDVTIVVFMKEGTTDEQIDALKDTINRLENVESIKFKSKEETKEEWGKVSESIKTVMDEWSKDENPLLDSFLVKVEKIEKISETAQSIEKYPSIKEVSYGKGMVDQLISSFRTIERITYIVVVGLVVVTLFLIINTIKLTIFSRKREISIMRLVGASNMTIKLPFVIEGMILGVIGSFIPIIITIYGYLTLYNLSGGKLYSELIQLVKPEPFIYQVSLLVIGIGVLVGMIGSARAVSKYLKV
jgi:cell division transport system permease protein